MDSLDKARRVIQTEIDELQRLLNGVDDRFSAAVQLLQQTVESGRKIVVMGIGKSYNIAHKIAATLNSTGASSVVLNSQNALHGDIGIVNEGDTVLALSYSGETDELLDILPALKRFSVKLVAITGATDSSLARNADIVLDVHVEREACPLNLAPTSSTTNMLVLGDALAMVLLETRGFREDDFARLHPGGRLGRALLTRVTDIMRSGDQLAVARPDDTIATALETMRQAHAGAVIVTGDDRKLLGIFTHGDFVRGYQEDRNIADQPLHEHMTANPITISGDKLAAEVLSTLEEHRIDDIAVVDESGHAIGLVDTQDLSRLKIL